MLVTLATVSFAISSPVQYRILGTVFRLTVWLHKGPSIFRFGFVVFWIGTWWFWTWTNNFSHSESKDSPQLFVTKSLHCRQQQPQKSTMVWKLLPKMYHELIAGEEYFITLFTPVTLGRRASMVCVPSSRMFGQILGRNKRRSTFFTHARLIWRPLMGLNMLN